VLVCDGKDGWLTDRKQELRRLLAKLPVDSRLRYVDHVDRYGRALFQRVCKLDLEGIVAKQTSGLYVTAREDTTWFKIRNREYSQMVGREELFERERHQEPVAGWHSCVLASAKLEDGPN
jgi:ATP-dependent DNA ligase